MPLTTIATPAKNQQECSDALAACCRALAHPARIAILRHLLRQDRCICGEIVEVLPLAQSTVSQHLKILKDAGLVLGKVEGPRTCYCADRSKLMEMKQALARLMHCEE